MRNIDYRELYQQVLENQNDPKKRTGYHDGLAHDQRTAKEVASNKARTMSMNQAKMGKGTGKKGVAPVAPENLQLATEEVMSIKEAVIESIRDMTIDELWEFMAFIDEQQTPSKGGKPPMI